MQSVGDSYDYDAFLACEVGDKESSNSTRKTISEIFFRLPERFNIFFDRHELLSNLSETRIEVIERSNKLLVFVSQKYMDQLDEGRFIPKEIECYAKMRAEDVIPVILDAPLLDKKNWCDSLLEFAGDSELINLTTLRLQQGSLQLLSDRLDTNVTKISNHSRETRQKFLKRKLLDDDWQLNELENIMDEFQFDESIQKEACASIHRFARKSVVLVANSFLPAKLIRTMDDFKLNEDIQSEASDTLRIVTVHLGFGGRLFQLSGHKRIVEAMQNHPKSRKILYNALVVIENIALEHEKAGLETIRAGVAKSIVDLLETFPDDENLLNHACKAILGLAYSENESRIALLKYEMVERINIILDKFHRNSEIVGNGCVALINLLLLPQYLEIDELADFKIRAMKTCFPRIKRILDEHQHNEHVLDGAYTVLRNLTWECNSNQVFVMRVFSGVFNLMLDNYRDIEVIQGCIIAVLANLAINEENKIKLIASGFESKVLRAMDDYRMNERIQTVACETLKYLATNPENRQRLIDLNAGKVIIRAIDDHYLHSPLLVEAYEALINLTAERPDYQASLRDMGAIKSILDSMFMHSFEKDREVKELGQNALDVLCSLAVF